ncbi:MAG TPA: rhodanese-like domain-containing protein [Verrucomicrobiae bacterium]|nr:rhodanese-like domain-containing protein [Verrucomicrobiae bacterium]
MKKILALLVTALVGVSAYAAEFADISVADVNKLSESKTAVIIDANGPGSYTGKGHVPGALDFNAIEDKLAASLPADKGALIVAYCGNPGCGAYLRAAKAAQKLGYTNIKHMSAGIDGWKEAGLKTEPAR